MGKHKYTESPSQKERQAFSKYLAEDEELILATGYSNIYLRQRFIINLLIPGSFFLLLILGIFYFLQFDIRYGAAIGVILMFIAAYIKNLITYHAHRYLLTTRRVMIKQGFFNVKLTSALYDKITHIEVDQGFYDRLIMHHGMIIINTAGMSKNSLQLDYVESPIEFKNLLERLINREREQFGKPPGSIITVEGEIVEE